LNTRGALLWADLMRRTFGFDVLACPRCGGRLRSIALFVPCHLPAAAIIHAEV
jgi:hypothetical protein